MERSFVDSVIEACVDALVSVGFRKRGKSNVFNPMTASFTGWVGLNEGNHEGYLRINPNVGIHCVPLERFWRGFEGLKYSPTTATIALPLGTFCADEDEFLFSLSENIEPEAKRLAQLYKNYAIPFYETHASYEALLPMLLEKVDMLGAYPERVAGTYYLQGRYEEARSFTESMLKKEKEYFSGFGLPFLKKLEQEGH
ncbi:hypothetical protein [Kordiimonas sp.]|uniref:hypothetical protein n=1 Tax=Kordiimonas sp. TaxID=1970157 RepID=UPI003A903000